MAVNARCRRRMLLTRRWSIWIAPGRLLAVVTQNIDGLHQKAGLADERVIELHGTNRWIECLTCKRRFEPQPFFDAFAATSQPPRCPGLPGGWLKSATVSFGQDLDPKNARRRRARGDAL